MPIRRLLATAALPLFLLGWLIALIGTGLLQSKCNESDSDISGMSSGSFLAPSQGDGCKRQFRFVWWVIALSLIPVLFMILAIIKPHAGSSASTGLWSVLAVLSMLMTNFFYNLHDMITESIADEGDSDDDDNVYDKRIKVALAGFALMSAGALAGILAGSLLESKAHDKHHDGGLVKTEKTVKVIGTNLNPVNPAVPVTHHDSHVTDTRNMREVNVV